MWPQTRDLRLSIHSSALICGLLLRVTILLVTIVMQLTIKPHMYCIKEFDLLNSYKYPRHKSYVSPLAMVFIIVVLPLLLYIPLYLAKNFDEIVQSFLTWSLALSINAFVTESIKLATGRPRPDYFYRCFPDGVMTEELRCTGELKDILEGRKSFPSGHSSFAFCSLGFTSVWMLGRVYGAGRGGAGRALAVLAPLLLAAAVAASRCFDNHHHWEDVVCGSFLGLFATYFCYSHYYNPLRSELSVRPYVLTDLEAVGDLSSRHRSSDIISIMQTPSVRQV